MRARLFLEPLETRYCPSFLVPLSSRMVHSGARAIQAAAMQGTSVGEDFGGPIITSFQAVQGPNNLWTFSGQVSDPNPGPITVTLGGLPGLQGQTVGVQPNGSFSITIQLRPGVSGIATAQATDSLAIESNVAMALVDPN
jgi:hypothetical protein